MPLKIYYLDDELDLLEMFSDTFSAEGREVVVFSDPKIAIEAIQKNPPDILFIDYRLPNYTGEQIAQMLNPEIPKVLITGDMMVQCTYKFEAILEKPFNSVQIEKLFEKFHNAKK